MKTRKRFAARIIALVMVLSSPTIPLPVLQCNARPTLATGMPVKMENALLTPDLAVVVATNSWELTGDELRLRHPRHTATFTSEGVRFTPRRGGQEWAWRLCFVGAGDAPLVDVATGQTRPTHSEQEVSYSRGGLVEKYVAKKNAVEQKFIIPEPLPLGGEDLVITGVVASGGTFQTTSDGWLWRTGDSAVKLGNVQVYDAVGQTVPARMSATADGTRIEVDGAALANVAYPVTIDPEIGTNDFRISFMGKDASYDASDSAVAYNSVFNEYLVVWSADDNSDTLVNEEFEIFGQRIDAATGARIGNNFRISDMGGIGDLNYDALSPAVAYNSIDNQYLVVWEGEDNIAPLVDNEFEIFGQRLTTSGAGIGANDFRISDMGPDGNTSYSAFSPAVAYNSSAGQYLVVWHGDDDSGALIDGEFEIFGQRLEAASGAEIGGDFRISDMGGTGNANFDALHPAVAYNSTDNQYLVVWEGDDNTAPLVDNEFEIYGQLLTATGAGAGANDFRISDMGPDGNTAYGAFKPAVAYNSRDNQYLVVWEGDDNRSGFVDNEMEIFAQILNAAGVETGINDRCLSNMGPDENPDYDVYTPAVAYNVADNEYLVVWQGDSNTGPLVDDEFEIFGQRLAADCSPIGSNDFRISDMGPNGSVAYLASRPAVAFNGSGYEYLVVWDGDDQTAELVDYDNEIFAQRLTATGSGAGENDLRVSFMGGRDLQGDAYHQAVAYNSTNNQFLVVWFGVNVLNGEGEIWGQRVDAATGALVGPAIRISDMGPDGDTGYDPGYPAVAYDSTDNQYLVVWQSDDNTGTLIDDEIEIFGQRINAATGAEVGTNDFRISDMGPDGDTAFAASHTAVAYNGTDNQYLVVWEGDDNTGGLVDEEKEIFGQRLEAASGLEVGADFRISDMGGTGNAGFNGFSPAVAYNSTNNQYLVVWYGDDNIAPLVDSEFEIFGQLLTATGSGTGSNDFRVSSMGPDGSGFYAAFSPAVAYNTADNQYLVVWYGDDNTGGLVRDEYEIFGQRLTATGSAVGLYDFRISDMGGTGDVNYGAKEPAVAYDSQANEYLVVWWGDDNTSPLADEEFEIFGQRLSATGSGLGDNDFRLSDMGPDGNDLYEAFDPAVAFGSTSGTHLVVWYGDDNTPPLEVGDLEIFGQLFGSGYSLSVDTTMGNGVGVVTSLPLGIDCGAVCSASFPTNSIVTLTAQAGAGSTFTGWAGDCSGLAACVVTMSGARAVTATFRANPTLTVSKTGGGAGTITSAPVGLDCGTGCARKFSYPTVVTLTAIANTGSNFAGWSGEGCSGIGTCQVTMNAARTVNARFIVPPSTGFYPVTPCRVFDTRQGGGPTGGAPIDAGDDLVYVVASSCGVPATASAIVGNVTVVNATATGDLKVIAGDLTSTGTSTLSVPLTRARANNATIQLDTTGAGSIRVINATTGTVHVILDVSGYFE